MNDYTRGLRAGIPIALGYLSVSFTFGIIAVSYGMTWWEALIISMTCVTSAGQFSGIKTMLVPGQYLDMVISQLTINIRYSFMSISLSQKVNERFRGIWRWIFGFMMTDEIFAVAVSEKSVSRSFMAGLASLPYIGWSLGTLLGAILGNILPAPVMSALGLAIYGMFVAIVVPEMKKVRPVIVVVIAAAIFSTCFTYIPLLKKVSSGIAISLCAIVAAVIGAVFFPVNADDENASSDNTENEVTALHSEEGGAV